MIVSIHPKNRERTRERKRKKNYKGFTFQDSFCHFAFLSILGSAVPLGMNLSHLANWLLFSSFFQLLSLVPYICGATFQLFSRESTVQVSISHPDIVMTYSMFIHLQSYNKHGMVFYIPTPKLRNQYQPKFSNTIDESMNCFSSTYLCHNLEVVKSYTTDPNLRPYPIFLVSKRCKWNLVIGKEHKDHQYQRVGETRSTSLLLVVLFF